MVHKHKSKLIWHFFIFRVPFQAEEEMNQAKNVYEFINHELKEELPVLYDRCDRKLLPVTTTATPFF